MAENRAKSQNATVQDQAAFTQSVKATLASAKEKTAGIRRTDNQLFLTNVISPAAATLIAALAAAVGGNTMFQQAAQQSEDGGWVLACALAAVFSFIATVSGVLKKRAEDRLTMGNQCVGRLLSLDLGITTGSLGWDDAAKEYGEILKAFPEFIS